MSSLTRSGPARRSRGTVWSHPVVGAAGAALPAAAALFASWPAGRGGLAALLAYLSMGTVAGYSVSGST